MNTKFLFPALCFLGTFLILCAARPHNESLKVIYAEAAPAPIGPYSQAIISGQQIYVSGQIGMDPKTGKITESDIKSQTRRALQNLNEILKSVGCTAHDVVKCNIYLSNMNDFAAFNEEYAAFFSTWKPARETVGVQALPMGAMVEISAIARLPK
jgi:2-iminobutanoate/2-iminopropanoate deaminase